MSTLTRVIPVVLVPGTESLGELARLLRRDVERVDVLATGRHDVSELENLRTQLGHQRWTVVGHHSGAPLALAYAAAHPERTAAVGYLCGPGLGNGSGRTPTDADLIGWAAATRCPVFFIHGSDDPEPLSNIVQLATKTPLARKRIIQGGSHRPWIECPDDTTGLLLETVKAGL